jgi:hypothetical protein
VKSIRIRKLSTKTAKPKGKGEAGMKKTLLYAAGFLEVFFCAGGILGLLKVPSTMLRMGVRPAENPDYFAGMVIGNGAVIALMVWLIILTRRKLNRMK